MSAIQGFDAAMNGMCAGIEVIRRKQQIRQLNLSREDAIQGYLDLQARYDDLVQESRRATEHGAHALRLAMHFEQETRRLKAELANRR